MYEFLQISSRKKEEANTTRVNGEGRVQMKELFPGSCG